MICWAENNKCLSDLFVQKGFALYVEDQNQPSKTAEAAAPSEADEYFHESISVNYIPTPHNQNNNPYYKHHHHSLLARLEDEND